MQNVEKILAGCEDGLEVAEVPRKGRGVTAAKAFSAGSFVVEYKGELIDKATAFERERCYERSSAGCYMYYFDFKNCKYCIDATTETEFSGRIINHSCKKPNLLPRIVEISGTPHLFFVTSRNVAIGEELLYDYGERDKMVIRSNQWLVKS